VVLARRLDPVQPAKLDKALQVSITAQNISGCATLVMSCLCTFHYRRLVLAKKGDFTRKATPLCPGMAS